MKFLIYLIACLLLGGCANTTIYEDGKPVFHTQADLSNFTFRTKTTYVHADTVNHSTPMAVQGQAVAGVVTAVGAAVVSGLVIP